MWFIIIGGWVFITAVAIWDYVSDFKYIKVEFIEEYKTNSLIAYVAMFVFYVLIVLGLTIW